MPQPDPATDAGRDQIPDGPGDARDGALPGDAGTGSEEAKGAARTTALTPHAPPPAAPGESPRRTGVFVDAPSLRSHVGELLRTYLGGYQVDAWGNFTFPYEDARVFVTVGMSPIGPQVGVFSVTNVDVDLSLELSQFLLTTNHRLGFGAFSYDGDNRAVWLRHTLLGTTLDAPELQAAVAAVASTAAHFDDRIRDGFGGRKFAEASDEEQQATHPPTTSGAAGYL